jgi:hypothetical protein
MVSLVAGVTAAAVYLVFTTVAFSSIRQDTALLRIGSVI